MQFHKLLQPPVGADLSCPPPIYRPSRRVFRNPDYVVTVRYRPSLHVPLSR
jgi:hypothetical protein